MLLLTRAGRDNAARGQHLWWERSLQVRPEIVRLPREERLGGSPLRARVTAEEFQILLRQRNRNRAHAGKVAMSVRPNKACSGAIQIERPGHTGNQ